MLAAVRNFVVVFTVAVLIFGTIAFFITGFIAENIIGIADSPEETDGATDTDNEVNPSETGDNIYVPDTNPIINYPDLQGESFNVLLIGTDYRPDYFNDYIEDLKGSYYSEVTTGMLNAKLRTKNADLIMLISITEETRTITFTSIPGETRVSVNGEYRLLSTCYDKYGAETIVDYVNYLTAVEIDYYICANVTNAGKILNLIDGVTLNIPTDIYNPYYKLGKDPDMPGDYDLETKIMIKKGEAYIDASNIFALLHYRINEDNIVAGEHESLLVQLAEASLKKAVSADYIAKAPELFSRAIAYTESNMTVNDLTDNLGIFLAYDEFTTYALTYPGTYSTLEDEPCFIPDTVTAYQMYKSYTTVPKS